MLYELLYTSEASIKMGTEDLLVLLETARRRNHSLKVSGLLLFHKNEFMQLIEGEKEVVLDLWDMIRKDKRHYYAKVIYQGAIQERGFSDWSMAFKNIGGINTDQLKGYSKILIEGFNSNYVSGKPSTARNLMSIIKNYFLDAPVSGYDFIN